MVSSKTKEERVMKKGAWSSHEDQLLKDYVKAHGEGKWAKIFKQTGLKRCGKSCRLRWLNYLKPDIRRGNITCEEDDLIIRLHKLLGNRWSLIAGRIPGRTDNEIKNYFKTTLKKRLKQENDIKRPSPKNTKSLPIKETTEHATIPSNKHSNDCLDKPTPIKFVEPSTCRCIDSKTDESGFWANLQMPIDSEKDHAFWNSIMDLDHYKISEQGNFSKHFELNSLINITELSTDHWFLPSSVETPEEFLKSTWVGHGHDGHNFLLD